MSLHLIKKYPNRRLYDTQSSKYITLTSLKDLITSGVSIQVVDSSTNEDITRNILLQIIVEAEAAGEPMFNSAMLQQIIRFYGGTMQGMFARYLEESMLLFGQQQAQFREQMGVDPVKTMTNIAEQNMQMWADFQANLFGVGNSKDSKDK